MELQTLITLQYPAIILVPPYLNMHFFRSLIKTKLGHVCVNFIDEKALTLFVNKLFISSKN